MPLHLPFTSAISVHAASSSASVSPLLSSLDLLC